MKRICAFGSRRWEDECEIWDWLTVVTTSLCRDDDDQFTIVTGACPCNRCHKFVGCQCEHPVSADLIADRWSTRMGLEVERHAAEWTIHGNAAGPIRNSAIAATPLDFGLGFWKAPGKGTDDMAGKLKRAGVTYIIVPGRRGQ